MNIKQAAERTGLNPKTLRYYEEIGLVTPNRAASGYRDFSSEDLARLSFIARARALGFSTETCRSLVALNDDPARASADVKAIAREHLSEVDQKLAQLEAMRKTLADLVERCAGDGQPNCPIIDDLAQASQKKSG